MTFTEQLEKLKAEQTQKILSNLPEYRKQLESLGFIEGKLESWEDPGSFIRYNRKPYKNITQTVFIHPTGGNGGNQKGYFGYHFNESKDPYQEDRKEFETFEDLLQYLASATPLLKPKKWELNIVKSGIYTSEYALKKQLQALIKELKPTITEIK